MTPAIRCRTPFGASSPLLPLFLGTGVWEGDGGGQKSQRLSFLPFGFAQAKLQQEFSIKRLWLLPSLNDMMDNGFNTELSGSGYNVGYYLHSPTFYP
jgi:hypothetical protein